MQRWTRAFLFLGALLTGLAFLPAALQLTILPMLDPILAALALYSVAPLGLLCLFVGTVLLAIRLLRR